MGRSNGGRRRAVSAMGRRGERNADAAASTCFEALVAAAGRARKHAGRASGLDRRSASERIPDLSQHHAAGTRARLRTSVGRGRRSRSDALRRSPRSRPDALLLLGGSARRQRRGNGAGSAAGRRRNARDHGGTRHRARVGAVRYASRRRRRGAARAAPVRHRLPRPRSAGAVDVRRARVVVHRHRRAVLLRADRHSLRQHRGLSRRTPSTRC